MNEREWLIRSMYYPSIEEEKLVSIFYFTLVWNIFEKECCDNNAKIGIHPRDIASTLHNCIDVEQLDPIFDYFQNRYTGEDESKNLFRGFDFGNNGGDYKSFVEEKLLDQETSQQHKVQALLYIAFRLRNNLYHGIKKVENLYSQNENFRQINILLMEIIDKKEGCR